MGNGLNGTRTPPLGSGTSTIGCAPRTIYPPQDRTTLTSTVTTMFLQPMAVERSRSAAVGSTPPGDRRAAASRRFEERSDRTHEADRRVNQYRPVHQRLREFAARFQGARSGPSRFRSTPRSLGFEPRVGLRRGPRGQAPAPSRIPAARRRQRLSTPPVNHKPPRIPRRSTKLPEQDSNQQPAG